MELHSASPGQSSLRGTAESRLRKSRLIAIGKMAAVALLLAVHFAGRWHQAQSMPLVDRHNYEQTYAYSLSLVAGKGFHNLAVPPTREAEPIAKFLAKESDHVSREQFRAFLANPGPADYDADAGEHNYWASSRILDQYVVAGLWWLFGIRWQVVFVFAAAMSTLACLCVLLIARRVGGSYWAGLIAGLLYFASPLGSHLETWSLRDASPLWFAAAGFCFLFCVVDRPRRPSRWFGACAALGAVAMVGIGWRPDVLLLVLYLGFSLFVLSRVRRLSWKATAANLLAYSLGAIVCHAAIFALSKEHVLDPQNGFQNAVYADFSRANLLEIENTFQIERCDRATLFLARQYERSHDLLAPPLPYKGRGFSQDCRAIFLEELRYNAFRLVQGFPRIYWKALNGLEVPGAFETQTFEQLQAGRMAWLTWLYRAALDPASISLPWLFLFGLSASVVLGRGRAQALLLGGLTLAQSAALLLVLPEQKHCGVLLLPLTVLGGIGVIELASLLRPALWLRRLDRARVLRPKTLLRAAIVCAAGWAVALFSSYELSKHERTNLIAGIHDAARTGVDAPEMLHGDKVFAVRWLPGESKTAVGYLLKISPGPNPGSLFCRRIHFPQDWCWPRLLETTHLLRPDREQYFFITCDQGAAVGDPRPYSCSIYLDGDARIESCRRVDLANWKRLPVSTLFFDGQNSPGSPRSVAKNSLMNWPNWPANRSLSDDWRIAQQYARQSLFVGPQPIAPRSYPLDHLTARNRTDGNWQIAISDGRSFRISPLTYDSPRDWEYLVQGDFDGDGMDDLLGRSADGSWWLGLANGNQIAFQKRSFDLPDRPIDFVGAGDFNGDGIDDLAIRFADGNWWIGLSDGRNFKFRSWGRWTVGGSSANSGTSPVTVPAPIASSIPAANIRIGDFSGDGHADIAGLDAKSGQWIVSRSTGQGFKTRIWGKFPSGIAWQHMLAADFTGTGRTDVAAWNPTTGVWTLGRSDGKNFECRPAGKWPADVDWQDVVVGRFGEGGRSGILGLDKKSGRLAIAVLDPTDGPEAEFKTRMLPGNAAFDGGIYVGRFNGDVRDNLAGWTPSGEIRLGIFDGNEIRYEKWAAWPDAARLDSARVINFWRPSGGTQINRRAAASLVSK